MARGVEVLRLKQGAHNSRKMKGVKAPRIKRTRYLAQPSAGWGRRRAATAT